MCSADFNGDINMRNTHTHTASAYLCFKYIGAHKPWRFSTRQRNEHTPMCVCNACARRLHHPTRASLHRRCIYGAVLQRLPSLPTLTRRLTTTTTNACIIDIAHPHVGWAPVRSIVGTRAHRRAPQSRRNGFVCVLADVDSAVGNVCMSATSLHYSPRMLRRLTDCQIHEWYAAATVVVVVVGFSSISRRNDCTTNVRQRARE